MPQHRYRMAHTDPFEAKTQAFDAKSARGQCEAESSDG